MRRLTSALLMALCLGATALGGCASMSPSLPISQLETNVAQNEIGVELSSFLATKASLIAVSDKDTIETAHLIAQVAKSITDATVNNTLDVTSVATLAQNLVANSTASPKQKLLASTLIDTIAILTHTGVDKATAGLTPTDQRTIAIRLVRAAASGAFRATKQFDTNLQ